jgi:hypothetical protein
MCAPLLLKEIAPAVARVALIFNLKTVSYSFKESVLHSIEAAAPEFAVKVTAARVHDVPEMKRAKTVAGGVSRTAVSSCRVTPSQ